MPIYHGKELWTHKGLDGKPAEPEAMIRQRMARDWGNALGLVKTSLAEDAPAELCRGGTLHGARKW